MTDKLMEQIEEIQSEINAKERLLVQVKNEWLKQRGWTVTNKHTFLCSYAYEKNGHFTNFEDEAMECELEVLS